MLAVRRFILFFACCGIFVGVFWDTVFEHIHGGGRSSTVSSEEDCPFIAVGLVSSSDRAKQATHGGVPDVNTLLGNIKNIKSITEIDRTNLPVMTQRELSSYNGADARKPILIGIEDLVIDVSDSVDKYGTGKGYSALAGKVATRAVVLSSFEEEDMSNDYRDFDQEQIEKKNQWVTYFINKYPVVALIAETG